MKTIRTRTLEVTVISGENLCIDRTPVKENMYVEVRAESLKCWSTKMARQEVGSLGTSWNEKLMVEVPLHAQSITLEVQCKTSKGLVGSIGLARIAISDVIPKEEEYLKMLSYRLRNWEGRRSGVINFSVKVKKEEDEEQGKEKDLMWSEMKGTMLMEYSGSFKPEIIRVHHRDHISGNKNGYVMGIPVWWNHPGIHA